MTSNALTKASSRRLLALCALAAVALTQAGAAQAAPHAPIETTKELAAKEIGHGIMVATGSAMPGDLMPLMREHALARGDKTNVYYMSTFASAEEFDPKITKIWHPNFFFVAAGNAASRQIAQRAGEGLSTLHRDSLHHLGTRIDNGEFPIDTVVVRVSPPDAEGYVSLGTTSDLTMAAVQSVLHRGGKIIAEVNPNVPNMKGNRIKYEDLSYVFHHDGLLVEANPLVPGPGEEAIAKHIAALVPDNERSTLQIGIGNALAGVGDALRGKPLDVWSELAPSGLLDLVNAPDTKVQTATFSFLHADNARYQAAAKNPRIEMAPSTVVNDPKTIAQKPNMVAVNTALEVDLTGNVNAERDGDKIIGFPGGQPDFMEGAATNPTGKAILALRSLAKGEVSTVVTKLKGPTTTPKQHVDYVVTEWGATARLRGQSDSFRAYQIISVASPLARKDLALAAVAAGLITKAQADELIATIYPAIQHAGEDVREELALHALEGNLLTPEQHTEIVVELLSPRI